MVYHVQLIRSVRLHLQVALHQSSTRANLDVDLVSLGPGYFSVGDEEGGLVAFVSGSVERLPFGQTLCLLVLARVVLHEVGEDAPVLRLLLRLLS